MVKRLFKSGQSSTDFHDNEIISLTFWIRKPSFLCSYLWSPLQS